LVDHLLWTISCH